MQSRTPVLSRCIVSLVAALMIGAFVATPASAKPPAPGDQLYVPPAQKGAKEQIAELTSQGDKAAAARIRAITHTPQAVWFEAGTPKSVKQDVRLTVKRAAAKRSVPVLVTYNIPFRDCAQFSAGGATDAGRVRGVDRRVRGRNRRLPGHRGPRARRAGHHPLVRPLWQRRRVRCAGVVPAGGGRPGNGGVGAVRHAQPRRGRPGGSAQRDRLPRRHAQRLAGLGRHRRSAGPGGRGRRRRVLPQRLQLSAHRQQRAVRPLDLPVHRLRQRGGRRRLLQLPEPVLERWPAAGQDRRAAGRVDRRRARSLRRVERRCRRPRAQHVGDQPALQPTCWATSSPRPAT